MLNIYFYFQSFSSVIRTQKIFPNLSTMALYFLNSDANSCGQERMHCCYLSLVVSIFISCTNREFPRETPPTQRKPKACTRPPTPSPRQKPPSTILTHAPHFPLMRLRLGKFPPRTIHPSLSESDLFEQQK